MIAEARHVPSTPARLHFALGCLLAAASMRLRDAPTRLAFGRLVVLAIGVAAAVLHLGCAATGIAVLRGHHADPVALGLLGDADKPNAAAVYLTLRPLIVLLVAGLAAAQGAIAWSVWRHRLKILLAAWNIGMVLGVALVACIVVGAGSTRGTLIQVAGLIVEALILVRLKGPEPDRKGLRDRHAPL